MNRCLAKACRTTSKLLKSLMPRGMALIVSLVLALSTPISLVRAESTSGLVKPAELEAFFDTTMRLYLDSLPIPGAVVSVVHHGELVFAKGYGYADLESNIAMDASSTLIRPGSASKPVTWTAVMQLVEQGLLDLHMDVNTYLDFMLPATFQEPVTLAHLLTHTPGFEDVGDKLFNLSAEATPPLRQYLIEYQPRRIYPPGRVQAYSNYGTALAAYLVERVSGETFDSYVEKQIFTPLSMHRSTLRQPLPQALASTMAGGYGFYEGAFVKGGFEFVGPYPAGAMSTTAIDMAAFMLAHLQEGRPGGILQPETVQVMHRQQFTPDPRLYGLTYGFMERRVNGYRLLYHDGDTNLFRSGLYFLPSEHLGLFVSFNGPGGAEARRQLLYAFMDHFFPAAAPEGPSLARVAQAVPAVTGEYHLARADYSSMAKVLMPLTAMQVSASRDGQLTLTFESGHERYLELEPGVYRHLLRDEQLIFKVDESGRMWLSFDGGPPFDAFNGTAAFRAPWYATSTTLVLTLAVTLMFFLASTVVWVLSALRKRWRGIFSREHGALARWSASLYVLLLLVFLLAFLSMLSDVHPAYGVPKVFFETTLAQFVAGVVPWLMLLAATIMTVAVARSWHVSAYMRSVALGVVQRFHYLLLTFMAWSVLTLLWYWNSLAVPG